MIRKVLSLDGGGIRGAATAHFLELVEEKVGPLNKAFDLIAGTSTGGIIALGLGTVGLSAKRIAELYNEENGKVIFPKQQIKPGVWNWICNFISNGMKPRYDGAGKLQLLKNFFGEVKLSDGCEVLTTAYDLENRNMTVFKKKDFGQLSAAEIANATSAAPTFFPPVLLSNNNWYIDGGVLVNCPAMCAYAEARRLWPNDSIVLISIGTGTCTRPIKGAAAVRFGAAQWFLEGDIMNILTDQCAIDYYLTQILSKTDYLRINSPLTKANDDMDDASKENIQLLRDLGKEWFDRHGTAAVSLIKRA